MLLKSSPILVAGLLAGCVTPSTRYEAPARPKNVLFIMADDLGWGELGSYGQEKIRTPHLDRLADEGLRLTQAYSGAPVCAPCRNVLMTGKHLGHVTVRGNKPAQDANGKRVEGQHPIPADAVTIAELFQAAGFRTGCFGKWGLGPVGSSGDPNAQGFDRFYGYNCQRVAHSYYPPHLWSDGDKEIINPEPIRGHQKQPEGEVLAATYQAQTYAPDRILEEAVRFLEANADEPFFCYVPFVEPHVAMQPPTEHVESYPQEWDERPYRGQCGYTPHPRPRAGYAAMITDLDEHVGTLMATLERLGLAQDTLVVFTSDNGTTHDHGRSPHFGVGGVDADFFESTADLRGKKGSVYEGGLRVPFLVRWPGHVAAGSVDDRPTYFPDVMPTLCAACGLEAPADVDGIDQLNVWTGDGDPAPRNPMVWVFPEYSGQVAVRFGNWKLIRRGLKRKNKGPDAWELYDMVNDRGETTNVADEHPDVVAEGRAILRDQADDNPIFPVPIPD